MMVKNARILMVVVAAVALLALVAVPWLGAAEAGPEIGGLRAEAGPSGPVIHLQVTGNPDTVHYSPQPGVWVIEMPAATWSPEVGSLVEPVAGIERADLSTVDEFGRRVTRLTVWLASPAQLELNPAADGLDLAFSPAGESAEEPEATVPPAASPADSEGAQEPERHGRGTEAGAPVQEPPAVRVPAAAAGNLLSVQPVATESGLLVHLEGDGGLVARTFTLQNPDRVVVDLIGVVSRVQRHVYRVDGSAASRVRVAQFRVDPEPVTRVVVDMTAPQDFAFTTTADGGELVVGSATSAGPSQGLTSEDGTIKITRAAHPAGPRTVPASGTSSEAAATPATVDVEEARLPPVKIKESAPVQAAVEAPPESPAGDNPWIADPSQLVEQAAATEVLDTQGAQKDYETKEVQNEERQFTGEPITLELKDADIKDVLRTFAKLTNLNIVVDPGVGGSVTVELHDVPWDQALDIILRINGLDYVLENNVLRVAPISRLQAEKKVAANFQKDLENAKPLKTVLKPLSYAQADYVAGLLSKDSYLLSERGSVTVDQRTNQLIIRDTVDRIEGILRLIESLDLPTQQVVIEGRIVETTRDFSHELGVNWGFQGVMDAEHGNDTGLNFPNNIDVTGRVALARGNNGTLSMTFGDILNTFNLDFTLSAAESDGLVRIVSSPRVTTQNMEKATVRSGLQIPVQTVANNTVTVQYVDATLKLDVTPQITAEGTVMLDIDIKKQEPVLGVNVQGGTNSPIFTRDAKTKLLVRDGGTTVIAGIYQLNDQTNKNRVPGLAKIPILGFLFRNKSDFKRHDELLIFITPRIVKY